MRTRAIFHAAPYKRYANLMTKSLVKGVLDMINMFPTKNSILDEMSPEIMVHGKHKLDMNMNIL